MEKGKFKEKTRSAESVLAKQKGKTRQGVPSEVPTNDVPLSSTCTQHHRTKTGPIRKALSTSSQRRRHITSLSLADQDATQSTLEKHNFVRHPQTTPTHPPSAVPPNRRERVRSRLFPSLSDDKENAETNKQSTEKVSASSSAQRQPLQDHVAQSSSGNIITGGTVFVGELSGTAATSSASPLDSKPEERQLLKVCNMVLQRWKEVCTHLCIPACKISESEQNNVGNVSQACFAAMLWWRDGNCRKKNSPPTWKVLLDVVREAGFPDIADTVQENIILGVL